MLQLKLLLLLMLLLLQIHRLGRLGQHVHVQVLPVRGHGRRWPVQRRRIPRARVTPGARAGRHGRRPHQTWPRCHRGRQVLAKGPRLRRRRSLRLLPMALHQMGLDFRQESPGAAVFPADGKVPRVEALLGDDFWEDAPAGVDEPIADLEDGEVGTSGQVGFLGVRGVGVVAVLEQPLPENFDGFLREVAPAFFEVVIRAASAAAPGAAGGVLVVVEHVSVATVAGGGVGVVAVAGWEDWHALTVFAICFCVWRKTRNDWFRCTWPVYLVSCSDASLRFIWIISNF